MQPQKHNVQTVSYRIALGGIITALCLICMFLTGVVPMFYLILPMIASVLIYIMAMETTVSWGGMTFVSVGLLSLFITPNKDAGIVFMLFFGYYPLLRMLTTRVPGWLSFLLRLGIFNGAVLIFYYFLVFAMGAEELVESIGDYGKYGAEILLAICNIMFVSYDYIMGVFPEVYRKKLKPRLTGQM